MKTNREILLEDIEQMDLALERLSESRDIWQNNIVWWLCKAVRDLLITVVKKNGN